MKKPRILIVEDEAIVARDIRQQLIEIGYEPLDDCARGDEAIALAETLRPDLVLMDIKLAGGMDGISAAQTIREKFALPVVFLTAFAGTETLNRAKKSEPFGYIIKPFDDRELRSVIEMALYKHQAEIRLRASEERFRLLFEQNPQPMALYELGTRRFLAVNDAAVGLYGYTHKEFLGLTIDDLHQPEEIPRLRAQNAGEHPDSDRFTEWRHRRKDGTLIQVEVSSRSLVLEGRRVQLALVADVTEKKLLREKFLHAQRLESLGMLAAGIAHDMNNMLAPIIFVGPLLRRTHTSPADLKIIGTLERSAERGIGLVRQILAFARGTTAEPRLTQVKHILRDVIELIQETFPKSIRLEYTVPSDLWPAIVNPTQVHQVLLNLCVNARDAMPQGGTLRLSGANRRLTAAEAREIPGAQPGSWLVLEVADSGTGITPEALAHIWEPFFTTKALDKGTGLGLSTVRGIVASQLGFIALHTEVGKGTTFRVFLPAEETAASPDAGASPRAVPKGGGELILVVDDEEAVRDTIGVLLGSRGYRVVCCADGVEAITRFNAQPNEVTLVITDVDMPNIGGVMLARVLLQLRPEVRLLVISGLADENSPGSALHAAKQLAHGFLLKPFSAEELFAAVHRLLAPAKS